jgi:hypothetical protein
MRFRGLVILATLITAVPVFAHGVVDQQYTGPFGFDMGLNTDIGVSQSFTPTADNLVAVDLFFTGTGNGPGVTLTVTIKAGLFDGAPLWSAPVDLPAGLNATAADPYVVHVDFSKQITLTPGGTYSIQISPDGGLGYGVAASFGDPYPGGDGYQGDFTCCGQDIGFRTYSGAPAAPTSKDQCKNGGWASFTSPHPFKNQGDCIQYVNTGK